MKIPSIIATSSLNILSGLANNSDSIIPMAVKDTISNCAIVATYKKRGGKDDARERAIEEFGTGAVWLFGIPAVKLLFDKTVYPLLKLKSGFDIRILKNKEDFNLAKEAAQTALASNPNNSALKEMADTLNTIDAKNSILKNISNKNLYKSLFIAKFLLSTALSAFALTKIIKYKQKTTQKRIEDEITQKKKQSKATREAVDKKVKQSNVYQIFEGAQNKKANPSFTGAALDLFMYNPIANTSILDGVITTTRLKEARKGERKEVALKEAFQIFFIYAIARPTQLLFENVGKHFNRPIELDPKIIFSQNAKQEIADAAKVIKEAGLNNLDAKDIQKQIYKLASDNSNNPLIQLLAKNGDISLVGKEGSKALNYLQSMDAKGIQKTINNILNLNKNTKNLKSIKAYKLFAVFANIAIGALAMGVLQPLVNIWMRKTLNNGDHRNPAIVEQERLMNQQ